MSTKQRTIRDFGCLEDQEDPEAFMAKVREFNANYRAENVPLRIEAPGTARRMYCEENRRQNCGYKFLEAVYNLLEIDSFIKGYEKSHGFRGEYSLCDIFKFLVLARILRPERRRKMRCMTAIFASSPANLTMMSGKYARCTAAFGG